MFVYRRVDRLPRNVGGVANNLYTYNQLFSLANGHWQQVENSGRICRSPLLIKNLPQLNASNNGILITRVGASRKTASYFEIIAKQKLYCISIKCGNLIMGYFVIIICYFGI